MAGRERHFVDVDRVPGAHDQPPGIRIFSHFAATTSEIWSIDAPSSGAAQERHCLP